MGREGGPSALAGRVFYETSFDLKQPKLELKQVSKLSKTRCLFWLFCFNIETTCFGVLIKPKQKKTNRNKLKVRKIRHKIDKKMAKN
jgi:hypothetical protein